MNADEKGIVRGCSKYNRRYVFSGNIICGDCGCKFKRRDMKRYAAYVCNGHIEDRDSCSNVGMVREESIKAAFATMMNKLIFGRNTILIPYRNMLKATSASDEQFVRLNELDRLIEENADKKRRLTDFFSKSIIDPAVYAEESDNLLDEESRLNTERNLLTRQINGVGGARESLEDLLKFTAKGKMLREFDEELTDTEEQETSYEVQVEHYTEYINSNPEWELAESMQTMAFPGRTQRSVTILTG